MGSFIPDICSLAGKASTEVFTHCSFLRLFIDPCPPRPVHGELPGQTSVNVHPTLSAVPTLYGSMKHDLPWWADLYCTAVCLRCSVNTAFCKMPEDLTMLTRADRWSQVSPAFLWRNNSPSFDWLMNLHR